MNKNNNNQNISLLHNNIHLTPVLTVLCIALLFIGSLSSVAVASNPSRELNNLNKGLTNWKNALGKAVVITNVVTNDSVSYNTISDAASALNVSRTTIRRRLADQKVLNNLYKISYI